MSKVKKSKKIKPDEYYNDGIFELARFGNVNVMKNNLSNSQHEILLNSIISNYDKLKAKINDLINDIKEKISICNPLGLLNFSTTMTFMSMLNKVSEVQFENEEILTARTIEYIQSVLVSSENKYVGSVLTEEDQSVLYTEVFSMIIELYKVIPSFYIAWHAKIQNEDKDIDKGILKYIYEAQIMSLVRGERYQVYNIEHLEKLLVPHDEVFHELWNMSSNDFINGIRKLEYSLSAGRVDSINNFIEMFDKIEDKINLSNVEPEEVSILREDSNLEIIDNLFGYSLYDVSKVTGWSESFVRALSYEMNEDNKFFNSGEFSGWPIIDLPIQKRPFIKINDKYYCFDYYNFFDNIYRIIQKTITKLKPDYSSTWSKIQQVASETMVEELFQKLLPGCKTYRDNYYPKNKSLKDCAENDILVEYDNLLFVIEVKAGSFTYTPAITDYKAHENSFKSLVEKADMQCDRTIQYINKNDEAPIYDVNRELKTIICRSNIKEVFSFCVTVDNFNEFSAKAEKLSFIKVHSGTIAISIDDLRAYSDYFESPLCFIHYLKQRKKATEIKNLDLNDELDHLGLYIKHNMYSITLGEYEEGDIVRFHGYREELDKYFATLHIKELKFQKPTQDIPEKMKEILAYLAANKVTNRTLLANYLLDLALEERERFSQLIEKILKRQNEIGVMFPGITFGEVRYCLYVYQQGIPQIDEQYKMEYIYSSILCNEETDRLMIELHYDKKNILEKVNFKICNLSDITEDRYVELREKGKKYASSRIESYKRQQGKRKLGRNDICPCGSGKKYKKCCGT